MNAIQIFVDSRGKRGKGHVEFIDAALASLKDYGLHKDLDVYKALLNVFPKGPLIPENNIQRKMLHFPVQQICCVNLLDQMEWYGVQPDKEVHDIVVNAFGDWNYSTKKIKRMLYWMPKLKYANKYLDRRHVEHQDLTAVELARVALRMMCRDAGTAISYLKTAKTEEDPFGKWIVSVQSPLQRCLISKLPSSTVFYVDGPRHVYVMSDRLEYCLLSTEPMCAEDEEFVDQREMYDYSGDLHRKLFGRSLMDSEYNVHQQADMTILGMCVLEENSQSVATAWINHLQRSNPGLESANILFRIKDEREAERKEGVPSSEVEHESSRD